MNKYTNSNVTLEEYIRLNNVTDSMIIEAADTIARQACELKESYERIETLENIIQGFDIESIEAIINEVLYELPEEKTLEFVDNRLEEIQTLLDNFKQRRG